jgi:hypothetical protein
MKLIKRPHTMTAIAVAATALAFAASWLIAGAAGPEPPLVPEAHAPAPETAETPLAEFLPSEKLPAGSSVAFPTDI